MGITISMSKAAKIAFLNMFKKSNKYDIEFKPISIDKSLYKKKPESPMKKLFRLYNPQSS
jgi:hypothetical protein